MFNRQILLFIFFAYTATFAKKTTPIEIKPVFVQYDSISTQCPFKLHVTNVSITDSIKNNPLGITRTGRKTTAPLFSRPTLDTILYLSLTGFLNDRNLSSSEDSANYLLSLSILNARITEISQSITQTMTAELTIEVQLINPIDSTQRKKFIIEAKNSREALDTTKLAEEIVRDAVRIFIQEMMKNITL
jgi:hypothetical protein